MSALSPRSGIQVSSVYPTYTHIKGQCPYSVCVCGGDGWVGGLVGVPLKALFLVSIISNTEINIYF